MASASCRVDCGRRAADSALREQRIVVADPGAVAGGVGAELHSDRVVAGPELTAHVGEVDVHPVRCPRGRRTTPGSVSREELKCELDREVVYGRSCSDRMSQCHGGSP